MNIVSYFIVALLQVVKESNYSSKELRDCPKNCIVQKDEDLEFDEYGNPLYIKTSLLK